MTDRNTEQNRTEQKFRNADLYSIIRRTDWNRSHADGVCAWQEWHRRLMRRHIDGYSSISTTQKMWRFSGACKATQRVHRARCLVTCLKHSMHLRYSHSFFCFRSTQRSDVVRVEYVAVHVAVSSCKSLIRLTARYGSIETRRQKQYAMGAEALSVGDVPKAATHLAVFFHLLGTIDEKKEVLQGEYGSDCDCITSKRDVSMVADTTRLLTCMRRA